MIRPPRSPSRRDFIRTTAAGLAGTLVAPLVARSAEAQARETSARSRVVVVHDQRALDADTFEDRSINPDVAQAMMDSGIRHLTGINDVGEAWKSLFPRLTPSTTIGIKINALFWLMVTHPKVIAAVVRGLTRMTVAGRAFPANNIIIWDRKDSHLTRAGFSINRGPTGARCFGTNDGYTSEKYRIEGGRNPQGISRILTEQCDYLINLSVLKNHGLAGVTLSLKNHYGTCELPWEIHDNYCSPAISILNALPVVRQKQVVSICDAIFGSTIDADRPPTVKPRSLILSKDPVALDATGARLLATFGAATTALDGMARHIAVSAAPPYNLGICDPARIELISVENPSSSEKSRTDV